MSTNRDRMRNALMEVAALVGGRVSSHHRMVGVVCPVDMHQAAEVACRERGLTGSVAEFVGKYVVVLFEVGDE